MKTSHLTRKVVLSVILILNGLILNVHAEEKQSAQGTNVYQSKWQECDEMDDCVAVSAGYNWTCVNKAYEKEAREFCRNVDDKGTAKCYQAGRDGVINGSLDPQPITSQPVCSRGKCACDYVPTWSGGREDACVRNEDCVVDKFLNWRSVNPSNKALVYETYSGASCSESYPYPAPQAACVNGKCSVVKAAD